MDAVAKKYLQYIQYALADAARLTPRLKDDDLVRVTFNEIDGGVVGEHARKKMHALAKQLRKRLGQAEQEDDRSWPIGVVVLPRVYGLRPDRGEYDKTLPRTIAPLMLFAKLDRDGRLSPDPSLSTPATIPRDVLEPNRRNVSIGRVEDADVAYAKHEKAPTTWADLMRRGIDLVTEVTQRGAADGIAFDELEIDRYERLDTALMLVAGNSPATFSIVRLLELLQAQVNPDVPLFDELINKAQDRSLLSPAQQLSASAAHLGQMEREYPLSASQREALMHHLASDKGASLLAVDGPPGTGKTTLLLSAIASLWVQHALNEAEPPIIVATSTNNQAVTNILHAFSKVKEGDGPLAGCWLDGIESYGLYWPAASKANRDFDFPVHEMQDKGKDAKFDAKRFENKVSLDEARTAFLQRFTTAFDIREAFTLTKAVKALHEKLKGQATLIERAIAALKEVADLVGQEEASDASVEEFQTVLQAEWEQRNSEVGQAEALLAAARQLKADWAHHQATESWWTSFVCRLGFRQGRRQRDHAFCVQAVASRPSLLDDQFAELSSRPEIETASHALVEHCRQALADAGACAAQVQGRMRRLASAIEILKVVTGGQSIEAAYVQGALDVGPRFTAFKVATHYWEARYLRHLEEQFLVRDTIQDSKAPARLMAQYRRLAMVHPCYVATLFTLPDKFIAWPSPKESVAMLNEIDLLIVDEAGQVSPEIGATAFALAKRALVVGDVDQIEPIWEIPDRIDGANALRSGMAENELALQDFRESGMSAANGSVMRLAQRATVYAKFPERGRGMFLSEHRRCWPEIIRMCNVLVYNGRLQAMRQDDGPRPIMPSVGFVHIPGRDHLRGGSRDNPTEASAIAKWLKDHRDSIQAAYGGEAIGKLVAVVTPFSAQSKQVAAALSMHLGKDHGITVGTVHSLQGAERRVVIFSPTYGLGVSPGATFIDRNASMLNVAISRAQDAFMVFGNMHLFHPKGDHPCAVIGRMLFKHGEEITDVDTELLLPGSDSLSGQLCRSLEEHRAVLQEAMATAQKTLVIVSPFLTESALTADNIEHGIRAATNRGVKVRVLSDEQLNDAKRDEFARCINRLEKAGAVVRLAVTQGVHSKMLLVDRSWLVVGSFNWLSAVRNERSALSRYESSMRYHGDDAFEMISQSFRDIQELVTPRMAASAV
ncbi:AAA domain-containing protein [Lysobacter sp. CA199]|uniref:AAA domain-containing protein n=1 Tax=Lysobacter sp. CA199 TaxID=3455608 RepID=UPI003F8D0B84